MKVCKVNGCGNPHKARGYCMQHYGEWWRERNPRPTGGRQGSRRDPNGPSDAERFASRWALDDKGCWQWSGSIKPNGYAYIYCMEDGRNIGAHRWSYEHHVGAIPDGMLIDHLCFNRSCVNPDHLRLATATENARHLSGPRSFTKSGLRNVHWNKSANKWAVMVRGGKSAVYGGVYSDLDEAARVAEKLRREEFGEFAGNA